MFFICNLKLHRIENKINSLSIRYSSVKITHVSLIFYRHKIINFGNTL